jgi:large subunit ribosomal protein L29
MAQVKVKDIRALSGHELDERRRAHEKELFELRQKKVSGQLDKPHEFKRVRKQIARILTIQREKRNG